MLTLTDLVAKDAIEPISTLPEPEYTKMRYLFIDSSIKHDIEQFHILTCPTNCTLHEEELWNGPFHCQAVHEFLAFLNVTHTKIENWQHVASTYIQAAKLFSNRSAALWLHTLIEKPELKKLSFLEELK